MRTTAKKNVERRKTRSARANYVPSMSTTALWTEEMRALVGVWGAEDVQNQIYMVGRNKAIFEKVASSLDRKPWVLSNMAAVQNED